MTATDRLPTGTEASSAPPDGAMRLPSPSSSSWHQVARLYRSEMRLFRRESQVLIFVFGFPIVTVLVLGGVFGTETDDPGFEFVSPTDFYAAAYFGVVLAAIGLIMLPAHIAGTRENGVLRRYDTAGFARWVFPTVQYLCGLSFALMAFAALTATSVLSYGMPSMQAPFRTIVGLTMGTLAFVSLGVALGMMFRTQRVAQGLGLTLFFPMFLLGGGGPPAEALTGAMRSIADVLPLTHVVRATQEPWLGLGDGTDHLAIVTGILLASVAVWLWRSTVVSRAN